MLTKQSGDNYDFDWDPNSATAVEAGTIDNTILRWNGATPAWEEFTAFLLPLVDGTVDQIMSTDGAGTLSFVDPGAGGGLLSAEYRFSTSTVAADPGSGRFRFDTAAYSTVTECLMALDTIARRHGGSVDKYLGDCIMAVFGVPVAVENPPLAAVSAALEMQESVRLFNLERRPLVPLRLRIGINTGSVVSGDVRGSVIREFHVLGDPVNVAARFKDRAPPGRTYVGAATHAVEDRSVTRGAEGTPQGQSSWPEEGCGWVETSLAPRRSPGKEPTAPGVIVVPRGRYGPSKTGLVQWRPRRGRRRSLQVGDRESEVAAAAEDD